MAEIQNSKQFALILFDILRLRFGIYLSFGSCNLLFPVYVG